jgi:UDP-N-acetylmuramoyl-L-alanyl-D-glutamate--2,6-diaminopimelate ligase
VRLGELVKELGEIMRGSVLNQDREIAGLTADSRAVGDGFLFAALPGAKSDGRAFIADAVKKGAAAILAPLNTPANDIGEAILITAENPRLAFTKMASRFHSAQPDFVAAVTGTNGKTSTVGFTRQIWAACQTPAASLGTLGLAGPGWSIPGSLTTPDPVSLHGMLADLKRRGVTHLAMEASSHGLDQFRLDGVRVSAAAFTNLSRDHLDYHREMRTYLAAKARLFIEILQADGTAVLNADAPEYLELAGICRRRGVKILDYGTKAKEIRLIEAIPVPEGQRLALEVQGKNFEILLPLAGNFQAMNALCALGLALAGGVEANKAVHALSLLEGVPGRLQKIAELKNGAAIYVDYAHTPDALETVIQALRPHVTGKLSLVFGCGGDRDPGKRPQMGAIAASLADHITVTDDNPRSEKPETIRAQILAACPGARESGDRATAIRQSISALETGDILIVAGKGHERGQIVGSSVLPFDDAEECRKAIAEVES